MSPSSDSSLLTHTHTHTSTYLYIHTCTNAHAYTQPQHAHLPAHRHTYPYTRRHVHIFRHNHKPHMLPIVRTSPIKTNRFLLYSVNRLSMRQPFCFINPPHAANTSITRPERFTIVIYSSMLIIFSEN